MTVCTICDTKDDWREYGAMSSLYNRRFSHMQKRRRLQASRIAWQTEGRYRTHPPLELQFALNSYHCTTISYNVVVGKAYLGACESMRISRAADGDVIPMLLIYRSVVEPGAATAGAHLSCCDL